MRARVVAVGLDAAGLAGLAEAARAIEDGALVAFPTETVYGIACSAEHPVALARLSRVKQRAPDKPYTIHVGRREDVARHVAAVPPLAERLMRRYWPGPLTIVFPTDDGLGVGLRMPSSGVALELLRRTSVPVVAPSANRSGEPPATTAAEAAAALGDELDLILDGGRASLGQPSTVVRVADASWEVLREGAIAREAIARTLATTIVFVCTANSCRSPMAEMLCKKLLAERLACALEDLPARGYNVLSAGTAAAGGYPASAQGVEAMRDYGLDLSGHRSQPVTLSLIEDADVVFAMAHHHAASILGFVPGAASKVCLLDPAGGDVGDPVGRPVQLFRQCAAIIERHLREVIDSL